MQRAVETSGVVTSPVEFVQDIVWRHPEVLVGGPSPHVTVTLGHGTQVSHEVAVEFGCPVWQGGVLVVPVAWTPVGHEPVLPSFTGELAVSPTAEGDTAVELRGVYTIPLGALGRFGDGVLGRRLARQSVADFLRDACRRLSNEVPNRHPEGWRPAPYGWSLRERQGA